MQELFSFISIRMARFMNYEQNHINNVKCWLIKHFTDIDESDIKYIVSNADLSNFLSIIEVIGMRVSLKQPTQNIMKECEDILAAHEAAGTDPSKDNNLQNMLRELIVHEGF